MQKIYLLGINITAIFILAMNIFFIASAKPIHEAVTDSMVTAKVKTELTLNQTTKNAPINVKTQNGVVVLTGTVNTPQEATDAIRIAAATEGVRDVDTSGIGIEDYSASLQDGYLTAKIEGALIRAELLQSSTLSVSHLKVTAHFGIVYLYGQVVNQAQKNEAQRIAYSVRGVSHVVNSIRVENS